MRPEPQTLDQLPTPSLVVERSLFDANVAAMSAAWPGPSLRPHVKAFKSTAIARILAGAGHENFCAATVREMEGLAAAGLGRDLLLANEVLDASRLGRLVDAGHRVTVAVDSGTTVAAAATGGVTEVLIDVNVGLPRCGCDPDDAGRLADAARAAGLEVRGVMGYEGHLMMADADAQARRGAGLDGAAAGGPRRGGGRRGLGRRHRHLRGQPLGDRAPGRFVLPARHRLRPPRQPIRHSGVGAGHRGVGEPPGLGRGRRRPQGLRHGSRAAVVARRRGGVLLRRAHHTAGLRGQAGRGRPGPAAARASRSDRGPPRAILGGRRRQTSIDCWPVDLRHW